MDQQKKWSLWEHTFFSWQILLIWGGYQPEHDGHSTAGHDGDEVAAPEVDEDHARQAHLAWLWENVEAEGEGEDNIES